MLFRNTTHDYHAFTHIPNHFPILFRNTTYDYHALSLYENHTLLITVVDCEMESDKNGACLYDKLQIYDGINSSAPLIVEFCCYPTSARPSFKTTGSNAYLIFKSDATNNFRGFKFTVKSDGLTTTTSTTTTTTTPIPTTTTTVTTSTTTTTATTTLTTPSTTTTAPSTSMSTSLPVVSTAATSTAAPAGTTTTPPAAASTKQAEEHPDSEFPVAAVAGGVVGGLLLIALLSLLLCFLFAKKKKKKRPTSVTKSFGSKNMFFSRSTTVVSPDSGLGHGGPTLPPPETNIFDLDLPVAGGKGNTLPPLRPPIATAEAGRMSSTFLTHGNIGEIRTP
ncbi:uncharacterized protein LOC127879037 [Dreissena polymorpha]|uniref:uncharacterized protein LOC127879037 n=1 Tax=Dreissena polymorpha TaxID=45954 RepID=UPI002264B216|nr:uncharacterized protein LOC127879037 [Dreissena polymorpha]